MATNYDINYDDKRFQQVEADKKDAISEIEKTYNGMIDSSDAYYQKQIEASKQWEAEQKKQQQAQTDFAIDKIEQQKAQAKKDYTKEQSGAYVDWQKQSNQYGANAEQIAANGLTNTGFSESSQVGMYNAYQNRVTAARESYNLAVLNYNNAIKDAQLQNNSILAEIAYGALQKQLELSLQGFQYKNQLLLEMANKKTEANNTYYARYQDVLAQINHENALKEEVRQADMANARQQEQIAIAQAELQLAKDKFAYQKQQDAAAAAAAAAAAQARVNKTSSTSSGTSRSSYVKKLTKDEKRAGSDIKGKPNSPSQSAYEYLNALIASGASKDKVANEISIALRNKEITTAQATQLRKTFTPRGIAY